MSNMLMSQRDIQFSKLNVLKVITERFVTKDHDDHKALYDHGSDGYRSTV